MAELEKKTKEIVEGVVLTLSENEANALSRLLGATAGNAMEIERIWNALNDGGYNGKGFNIQKTGTVRIDVQPVW